MYSASDFTGRACPTTSTVGLVATVHSGLNDFTASNFTRPAYSPGIMVWLVAPNSSV